MFSLGSHFDFSVFLDFVADQQTVLFLVLVINNNIEVIRTISEIAHCTPDYVKASYYFYFGKRYLKFQAVVTCRAFDKTLYEQHVKIVTPLNIILFKSLKS